MANSSVALCWDVSFCDSRYPVVVGIRAYTVKYPLMVQLKPFSRLPEIPLPKFNGDFDPYARSGIDFRSSVVRNIPISTDNYVLALSTMPESFYRQQLAATSLIDELLHASTMTHDSQSCVEGKNFGKARPMSSVIAKVGGTCPCCPGTYTSASYTCSKSWSIDDRTRWTQGKQPAN
ncbi:Uncharacterized protein FWK35_00023852 [Aphis craccivora]|uniref:Uncharacterized protein n=1 Tax=Aphis craccivora TaxID=307492 RepID=A0A6G0Z261_APHCR|nr:Uncharacterized protein FWK35_00023852 [Aphis craccivora]